MNGRHVTAGLVLALSALLSLVACGGSSGRPNMPRSTEANFTSTSTATVLSTGTEATNTPIASVAVPAATPFAGEVARLQIARFSVDSPIENLGLLPHNQLDVPKDPLNTGWYGIYDRPGWGGNAVFSAHVDYWPDIKGPFYRLAEMEAGDEVVVVMEDGTRYTYEVFSNTRYPVSTIPMGDIIWPPNRPEGEEWITLITCGGRFQPYDGSSGPGEYLDRDVVVARRVSQ